MDGGPCISTLLDEDDEVQDASQTAADTMEDSGEEEDVINMVSDGEYPTNDSVPPPRQPLGSAQGFYAKMFSHQQVVAETVTDPTTSIDAEDTADVAGLTTIAAAAAPMLEDIAGALEAGEAAAAAETREAAETTEASEGAGASAASEAAEASETSKAVKAEQPEDGKDALLSSSVSADGAPYAADRASDVEPPAIAPPLLTEEQALELIAKVEEMRHKKSNNQFVLYGWKCVWRMRPRDRTGDMVCYAPVNENKYYSLLSMKRALGLVVPEAPDALGSKAVEVAAEAAGAGATAESASGQASSAAGGYLGLGIALNPTRVFSDEEVEEIFHAVELMRRRSVTTDQIVHGWRLQFTLRGVGSSTRGDMCATDPRDGQRIFSVVGMRRKLAADADVYERAAGSAVAEAEAEGYIKGGRRKRGELDLGISDFAIERESRRARTARVNYAEVSSSTAPRWGDVLQAVMEKEKAKAELLDDEWPGVDLLSLAEAVHRTPEGRERSLGHLPVGQLRQALTSLLRQGRLRRCLARGDQIEHGSIASALRLLVLNTLQVENDDTAPWSVGTPSTPPTVSDLPTADAPMPIPPPAAAVTDAPQPARRHVWKGVTPPWLETMRGAQLIGEVIDVWWHGSQQFVQAAVVSYQPSAGPAALHCRDATPGTHLVVYQSGLRSVEHLEGPGEPLLWRLADGAAATFLRAQLAAAGHAVYPARAEVDDGSELLPDPYVRSVHRRVQPTGRPGGWERTWSGGGGGSVESDDDDDDDDDEPPIRVTLRCEGCTPVGSRGTKAYADRLALKAQDDIEAAGTKQAMLEAGAAADDEEPPLSGEVLVGRCAIT